MDPQEYKYYRAHTWVKVEGNLARIGITDFAQKQLRDIVFANVFDDSEMITAGTALGSLESVKSTSDVIAPIDGKIVEINAKIFDNPEIINQAPYSDGYMVLVEIKNMEQVEALMSSAEYAAMLDQAGK
ncbi:MAG: glycine cleavage system protein [Firmicutes bacterium]|nr:glycine cleavage system protein [Bacillota bacterium]